MNITIIGAGRVGSALAIELNKKGYKITAIVDRTESKAKKISKLVNCKITIKSLNQQTVNRSDLILISIKDDDLLSFHKKVRDIDFKGKIIVHTSGLLTSEIFKNYKVYKRDSASFHPAQTFPKISYKNNNYLKGIYFGIEGGEKALRILKNITKKLGSNNIILSKKKKSMYHLGCVISSNFMIANFYILKELSSTLGLSEKRFLEVLKPLFTRTAENIHTEGVINSLTGPVIREDIRTIQSHLDLLHGKFPKFVEYYKTVSKILADVSERQNKNFNKELILDIINK